MSLRLHAFTIDALDPTALADFWGAVLGFARADETTLTPSDELGARTGFRIGFRRTAIPKHGPNLYHFDLTSSSLEDQQETVDRVLRLGGRHLDIGQGPDTDHVVMADPEGNEFCVIEHWNNFLAGCPTIGALSGDGLPEVGYFWSRALDWPLVWDQDQETAIQAPAGGSKITWGGPPLNTDVHPDRVRFELSPAGPDADQAAEIDRLVTLGAVRAGGADGVVLLTDPGGTTFPVLAG